MDKEKLLPSLRFSGYKDTWERNKLEHYLNVSNEKNTEGIFGKEDVLSVSGDFGIINQIEFHGRSFAGVSTANYGVVNTGDVVYTKSPLKANPFGIIKTNKGPAGIVSTLYAVYHTKENVYPDFIQVYFEQHARMNQYMHPLVNKGAKNDMKVSDANALKGHVIFPKVDEEEKIVEYFSNVDQLIALHQREYDKLHILKKAMLEKMFPQKEMDVPQIRFKGFAESWEQCSAKIIFRPVVDKGHPELPVLSASQEYGMINRTETGLNIHHDIENESGYKRVLPGQFVIHLRSFQGGFAHSNIEGITSPAYTVLCFQDQEKHYDYFWKYVFSSESFIRRLKLITYGIRDGRSISYEDFSSLGFLYPSYEEQKQIGIYFQEIDRLIILHQRKLEKLKNIKAGCLEKMFV
jgi:type I restriction enzyme S subunit